MAPAIDSRTGPSSGLGLSGPTSYSATDVTVLVSVSHYALNAITGSETVNGFGAENYTLTQTLSPSGGGTLTVTESGTAWSQISGSTAGLTGLGSTSTTGSDEYTLGETGTAGTSSVSISVNGLDSNQTVNTVNARTGAQSIASSGTEQFTRLLNGSSDSGTLSWSGTDADRACHRVTAWGHPLQPASRALVWAGAPRKSFSGKDAFLIWTHSACIHMWGVPQWQWAAGPMFCTRSGAV
jgi:hypothetical protein